MTRNHWMMLGFLLVIVGMFVYLVAPVIGRVVVWVGVVLAWLGIAVAVERRAWPTLPKLVVQALFGAGALGIAMTVTSLSMPLMVVAIFLGGVMGAFAPLWTRWISGSRR
ncbi:MAG TPA: hypothetical protein PLJ65_11070 [Casimicrobium sp.]|mgnify:FL=1|jgi:hypothetical protein|nr:hypothetical protein [Casimicrobium sp.]